MAGIFGVGVDIGSTATKVAVLDGEGALVHTALMPTGFSASMRHAVLKRSLRARASRRTPPARASWRRATVASPSRMPTRW